MVEDIGIEPISACLQSMPADPARPPNRIGIISTVKDRSEIGARGPYRADSFGFSDRRNDLICHPGEFGAAGRERSGVLTLAM
jgi:hypothetical protein